jgi:nitrogen fixation protein
VTYALVRSIHPPAVLEIGVRFGLGSLVILRALERNASEGHPEGELISVDIDPYAGSMVDRNTPGWTFVAGPSPDVLADAVGPEHRVGLVISDSVPQPWVTTAEVRVGLEHAARPLVLMQSGWNLVVPDLCDAAEVPWARIVEEPTSHIGAGRQAFIARLSNQDEVDATLAAADRWPGGRRAGA